jgi:WD40 repeat protein
VVHATAYDSRIAVVTAGRMVSIQRLQRPGTTFGLGGVDHSTAYALEPETTSRLMLEIDVDADSLAHSQSVNVALKGKVLLSVGHWDRSMRIFDIEEGREMQRISAHRDVTTCLALCELGSSRSWDESSHQMDQVIVVTGSRDTTLAIWEMVLPQGGWGFSKGTKVLSAEPKMICFGHDEAITCVAMNSSLNLVASGSIDGTLILHDSRDGHIVRALESTPPGCIPSSIELLPKSSLVVCACGVAGALSVHDVNGATLAKSLSRHEAFDAFCVTRDERHILIGNRRGDITVRAVHDLSIRAQINVANAGVVSISPVARDECLVVGLADGRVCLWAPAARSL